MLHVAYYEAPVGDFCTADPNAILGVMAQRHGFALEHQQRMAWLRQIELLKLSLKGVPEAHLFFEFAIPRMGKRADALILLNRTVVVVEFKVGADTFDRASINQVHDYALDLKNFHRGSHSSPIIPLLISTAAPDQPISDLIWAQDMVATPVSLGAADITRQFQRIRAVDDEMCEGPILEAGAWARSGYQPTPTIVEAAQALYQNHNVSEITRSDAGAMNLTKTTDAISAIIKRAKTEKCKAICFVTGVPGAGKTLAGLNVATQRAEEDNDEHAVFLSGNGPLVAVLREALVRDQAHREEIPKREALRKVESFIQNIHHFRDQALRDPKPPDEKIVIFDEAQRAWTRHQASRFMQQKRGYDRFDQSEPDFLISAMARHDGWCVIICLVGGGQEINTGEAGLAEWLYALRDHFSDWTVYASHRLDDPDYIWDNETTVALGSIPIIQIEELHLGVSVRSFRAEAMSEFVGHVVDNRPKRAREIYDDISARYPIVLTRNLETARRWLRSQARSSERVGLLASSGALRLRPEGLNVKAKVDAPVWFLNGPEDVRSSFYLEEVATEFDVQGLELDWIGVCWDGDFRYHNGEFQYFNFRGTKWQRTNKTERQLFLKNAYRVLLTRARQGMVIYLPTGHVDDPTRPPSFYDPTAAFLAACGVVSLDD